MYGTGGVGSERSWNSGHSLEGWYVWPRWSGVRVILEQWPQPRGLVCMARVNVIRVVLDQWPQPRGLVCMAGGSGELRTGGHSLEGWYVWLMSRVAM